MSEPTYCNDCVHKIVDGKNDPPWRWMCGKHKRGDGYGFVTPTTWDNAPPYLFCKDVNAGMCPLFERDDGKQMRLTND